jgi:DNA-binding response OmpR family regulator
MSKPKLLIIDDNATIRRMVTDHFLELGFAVSEAADGVAGLEMALKARADIVILDVMMPGLDGFKVCAFLRGRAVTTPIIILTDRTSIDDKVAGFECGADDYLAKPFSARELELRVRALLRRTGREGDKVLAAEPPHALERGGLHIDLDSRSVLVDDRPVDLTPIEFNILKLLAWSPGRVYTRKELLDLIWDTSYDGYKRNIDPHITRLRTKIEVDPRHPNYIQTVWGVGYKFSEG